MRLDTCKRANRERARDAMGDRASGLGRTAGCSTSQVAGRMLPDAVPRENNFADTWK